MHQLIENHFFPRLINSRVEANWFKKGSLLRLQHHYIIARMTDKGEKVNTHIITLTRFLTEEQIKHQEASGDFTYVLFSPFRPLLHHVD